MAECELCGAKAASNDTLCEDCIAKVQDESEIEVVEEPAAHHPRTVEQLIFVGLNGYALALDRDTGEIVWFNDKMKSGYVSLLLDGDRLIVSTNGYMFCLNPLTGKILWNNPLSGYGMGTPTSVISVRGQSSQTHMQQADSDEMSRRRNSSD